VNGALVISAGVGLVAYQQLLQLSPRQRQRLIDRLQKGLPLPATLRQQALVLGLVAGTTTYTFSALWHSTHSLLMALLLTGQGALALYALGALVRSPRPTPKVNDRWNAAPLAQVDYTLTLLDHPDPLKRLVAVRRLTRLASEEDYIAGVTVRSHLIDCFRLRLGQESDGTVRSALEDGLRALSQAKALPPATAAPWLPEPPPTAIALDSIALNPIALDAIESDAIEPEPLASISAASPSAEDNSADNSTVAIAPPTPAPPTAAPAPTRRPVEYVELDI
jgi:hypothetical protein